MNLSSEDLKAINAAASAEGACLKAEDRFDLRQELVLKLLEREKPVEGGPQGIQALASQMARAWVLHFFRDARRRLELLEAEYKHRVPRPYRRSDADWFPTWYPPHRDAVEHVPFECQGARVMHVRGTPGSRAVQHAMAEWLDYMGIWKKE